MQALPHHGAKKRLVKIRLQKIDSLQGPPSDYGLQWKPFVLSVPPSPHQLPPQLQPTPFPSHISRQPTSKRTWYKQTIIRFLRSLILLILLQ
jgi:hypothetical protein